ncbi:hypothetical protein ACFX1Q_038860 [Malus domestica]
MLVVLEKQFQVLKSNRCLRFELACNQVLVSLLFSVGLSNGSVAIASIGESQLETQETWKAHDFEVWTASYDIHQPQLVYSGSDDCKFKCWDLRDGGGVWRIKFHPFVAGLVLTACMHNGFSIVYINEDKTEVIETYSKHESLAFGADWHRDKSFHEGKRNSTLVATCSFYDRLLRLWMLESDLQDSVL